MFNKPNKIKDPNEYKCQNWNKQKDKLEISETTAEINELKI